MKKLLLFFVFSSILYSDFASTESTKLDIQEVETLKEIWENFGLLGKEEWDFGKGPCGVEGNPGLYVKCDCSFESNTTCHVIDILMISQNVSSTLPSEFSKLRYLEYLDLSRNYLRGSIPSEWATMRLRNLSLMGNMLYGPFPTVLTKITTLLYLSIEGNHFSGAIPKEIANLKKLTNLVLSSNDFTEQLPVTLAELTNLTDLRLSDNNFKGKIPNFISQWTQIRNLHIQGCSFEGPIPSSISVLTQLNDLRISDLKGGTSTFPPLETMTDLSILVLRNCLIHGPISKHIGFLLSLQTLDLSFNNLTGTLPPSLYLLRNAGSIYLTKNDLTGPMPRWIFSRTNNIDVSYNHFTWDANSGPKRCEQGTVNMLESYSSSTNEQDNINPCLRKDFPCTKSDMYQIHSIHINCGGEEVDIKNNAKYDADTVNRGASSYYNDGDWAFSSTGNFLDMDERRHFEGYILSNKSNLHNIPTRYTELYTKARTAAISLTYYGLCLVNGNYNVRLHFAEIGFATDNSSYSLGKRVFNVYVQGELKLIDFDIAKEAGGTGIAVIKSYVVNVTNNTLKIQLYWAGKGTTGIPVRGSYGPIISAISVDPNFLPAYFPKRINVGIIVGIVCGVSGVLIIMIILWWNGYLMTKSQLELGQLSFSHNSSFS